MEVYKRVVVTLLALALLAGAGLYIYTDFFKTQEEAAGNEDKLEKSEGGVDVDAEGDFTLEVIPPEEWEEDVPPPPSLNRTFDLSGVHADLRSQTQAQIDGYIATLEEDPRNFNTWMELALLLKSSGDAQAARDYWEYAGILRPQNSVSFLNLGVLYGYTLGNNAKAEENFLQAIANDPEDGGLYFKLYEFYSDIGETEKARLIIEEGVEKTRDEDLQAILESLS